MCERLFGRFHRRTDKRSDTQRHGCHPYSECIWHRAAHTETSSEVTVLDEHLYRRLRIRHRRNHPNGKIFRLVYGAHHGTVVKPGLLEAIQQDLQEAGIKVDLSPDINRDTFIKWSFISAMAVTGAYYDVPMGEVQETGKDTGYIYRTFYGKQFALGKKLGVEFPEDPVSYNLKVIDKLDRTKVPLLCKRPGTRTRLGNTGIALRHDCSDRRTGNKYTNLPDGCGEIQKI